MNTREEFEKWFPRAWLDYGGDIHAITFKAWEAQQKKIKRLEAIGVITLNDRTADVGKKREYCSVSSVELDAQEAYIEQLEREKERSVKKAFIFGYEKGHNDTVESGYGYIEDKADDYWQELKEERG